MLTTTKETEPLKWRFYHASHVPEMDNTACMDLSTSLDGSLQVEDLALGQEVNGDLDRMHHSGLMDYDLSPGRASPRAPIKALHDLSLVFPDTDSGFGSFKSRSHQLEDFSPTASRLPRSRSLSRLNGLTTQEMTEMLQEKPLRHLQTQLEDSEARRTVLMHKLKEAQATLELQNDRLAKIETSAKDNSVLVEDLKFKEREYRKKITQLQASEEEKQMLQMENIRLREEMQNRIDTLDFQLKSLKSQHLSTEDDHERRVSLLDQTTAALSLLEEENSKLQRDRDKLREEISVMKEAFQLSKTRYSSIEEEGKSNRAEMDKLREENQGLNKRVHEMAGQMIELRSLLQAVKDDNERLSSSWKTATEGKSRASKQVEGYQDTLADLKSRLSAAVADKDRLFQERLDLNNKVQKMILEKEQLLKAQMILEEQIVDQQKILEKTQNSTSHQDNQKKYLEDELAAVKRVSEDLSTELASVKAFYERALEQLSVAENGKKIQEQQLQLAEQERKRLQGELARLTQIVDGHHRDEREERQHLEETILKMRNEMKGQKYDKEQLTKKCQEIETKLKKANDEIRGGIGRQHKDMETWKTTCDRLTSSVTRKETELQNLSDKCHNLEKQLSRVQEDLRQSKEKEEISSDVKEDLERLQDENRRLLQEKAENEQMLQLLETQRDVLSKSTESSLNKLQDVEQLSGKVDQMRSENELLRQRISELEKVRDNLIKQKEELLASGELIYKSQSLEELECKMEELREANKHLRDINEVMSNKMQIVEQENLQLKQSLDDGSTKIELRRLQEENSHLLGENKKMRKENQQIASHTSKDLESSTKELQKMRKERDALQKQVQLINGQLSLLEGSKKRSDETAQRTLDELTQVRSQLEANRKECAEAKRVAAQVKNLSEQLHRAKEQQESQEKLIRTMKEESLEDVGAELQQMSGQLHKLMREIENKEQTIESLEGKLRTTKDTADAKEHTINELKKLVSDLEMQITSLKNNLDVRHGDSSSGDGPSTVFKSGEKSLKEELEEAVKNKQEADHAAEAGMENITTAGKIDISVAVTKPDWRNLPLAASSASSAQLPLFVLTAPSSSSEEDSATDTSANLISPQGYPRTSTPHQPGTLPKPFTLFNHPKKTGSSVDRENNRSSAHSASSSKNMSKAVLCNVSQESGDTEGSEFNICLAARVSDDQKKLVSDKTELSCGNRECRDNLDFPQIMPHPVGEAKPKLSFAKPQPASKTKARKLPQIKLSNAGQGASSALTQKTPERKASNSAVLKPDYVKQKSQLPITPKVPAPASKITTKVKSSPRESRNLFMSRKELTGKPSKLLSDSGVMVIATKTGSSQNASTDVKYVVKKQETSDKIDHSGSYTSPPSIDQSNLLKSFDDLLSGDSSQHRAVLSEGTGTAQKPLSYSKSQTSVQPLCKQSGAKDQPVTKVKSESAYSKLKLHPPSQQPEWKSGVVSESTHDQETSTTLNTSVPAKSSSVKDFLASFSTTDKKAMRLHTENEGAQTEVQKSIQPFISKFSGSDSAASPFTKDSSDSLESVLPKEQSEKEKLAQLIVSLSSDPSFGSSLSSTDSWSLLLDETAGERTLSYEKLEQLASKTIASVSKAKEFSSRGTREPDKESQDKKGLARSSSTSSLSSGVMLGSIMKHSLEEGQPAKFKPATGLFLSKSLGHPISVLGSQQTGGDTEPEKSGTDSGDRLQSLISKYRSHSSDSAGGQSSPRGGARIRESSAPPAVRSGLPSPRGRGFTPGSPKAPLLRTGSSEAAVDASSEKSGKKLPPPPPPPKPGKSLMKSLSAEGGAKAEGAGQSGEMLDSQEQSDINALIQNVFIAMYGNPESTSKFLKCKQEQRE
ncbi:uncharacterized protein LOC143282022 isoform X3 [Babylonia areolata]|uniref:uncharacterized protein LOC143282022 isoform X3 n=1 Tax=Babylonia areolata TaxID=304850 RepID=UPI003FD4E71E